MLGETRWIANGDFLCFFFAVPLFFGLFTGCVVRRCDSQPRRRAGVRLSLARLRVRPSAMGVGG